MAREVRQLGDALFSGIKFARENGMGSSNAVAFLLLGSLMGFLPALMPVHFSSSEISTSELWLEFMGILQGSLGMFYLIRNEVQPVFANLTAWSLSQTRAGEQPQSGVILRPAASGFLRGQDSRERTWAA